MKSILDENELRAMLAIEDAAKAIIEMDERGPLQYNRSELTQAVHVLQGFVTSHAMHRLSSSEFSDWWKPRE